MSFKLPSLSAFKLPDFVISELLSKVTERAAIVTVLALILAMPLSLLWCAYSLFALVSFIQLVWIVVGLMLVFTTVLSFTMRWLRLVHDNISL